MRSSVNRQCPEGKLEDSELFLRVERDLRGVEVEPPSLLLQCFCGPP